MVLFDSHAHLDDGALYSQIEDVLSRAKDTGVQHIVTIGQDIATSKKAIEIAHRYPNVYATIGIHPNEVKKAQPSDLIELAKLIQDEKVVAVGEIGLDYHWDDSNKEAQKAYFITQIEMAYKYNKVINIHARDAAQDTFEILKSHKDKIKGCILHSYSFSKEMGKEFIKLGFYISLGGPVTFKNAKEPKIVATTVPLDKLLIETDSPCLAPEPKRGTMNEPANVKYVCECIANLRGISSEEVAEATTKNALKISGIKG